MAIYDFIDALADPKHEQHDDVIEWGSDFDPKDAMKATKAMKKGLPDWRST